MKLLQSLFANANLPNATGVFAPPRKKHDGPVEGEERWDPETDVTEVFTNGKWARKVILVDEVALIPEIVLK